VRLVLLGQPEDGWTAVAAELAASLDASIQLMFCDSPEQAPTWSELESSDLVLLVEHSSTTRVDWRQTLMSSRQAFQVIHPSTEPLWQELQWALGHHLQRTTGHSPWPLRSEIAPRWQGVCEKCSDPECEHQLFRQLMSDKRHPSDYA
jgi:hypothetical protein